MTMEKHENNVDSNWLYSVLMLHLDIVHLHLQFYWDGCWVVQVSVTNKEYDYGKTWKQRWFKLTLFFCNASLRYCALWAPILLLSRSSCESVCNQ